MRWSRTFIPTLRENPAGVESASHRLLLRAGYIRQLMAGHYTLLPLGVRVRRKVIEVVREEMDAIGGQELLSPALHPAELWERSGRWETMGPVMFRLRDRRDAELALGVTHEEVFTTLALELGSYRDLPQIWYQVQTKFRDEPRPKGGLLRTREFTMKDAYSLDLDDEGLERSFELHHHAYRRIFDRLDVPVVAAEASSGAMGGSASTELMSVCEAGEDEIVTCGGCGYAANVERAVSRPDPPPERPRSPEPERFDTPGVRTIQELADPPYDAPASRQIKTLAHVVDGVLTLVLLRGDDSLVEQKLVDVTGGTEVLPAHPDEIRAALGALPGSLGAVGVSDHPVVADEALRGERAMVTGANVDDVHLRHVDFDRDVTVTTWADLRQVEDGEACARCGAPLRSQQALEVGHIFKLGRGYAEALGARVQDREGGDRPVTMGSYGIGIERAMAAIVETHYDDRGIVWPMAVAPFEVAVVALGRGEDDEADVVAARLYEDLVREGIDVLLDDRPGRPGAKLNDVELIGVPYRVVVGPRGLASGVVELGDRRTGETEEVPRDEAAARTAAAVAAARATPPVGTSPGT